MMKQAEQMVQKKPREFLIGFIVIIFLFLGSAFLAGYFYYQTPPKGMVKPKVQPTMVVEKKEYYVLQEGQSLSDVAAEKLGDSLLYPTIVELNKIENPDQVEPGTKLRIK